MKKSTLKKCAVLAAVSFFLTGCIPGILVTKKGAKIDGQPTVEYRLGKEIEMKEWVLLKEAVCGDLDYATEGLPADIRKDILKYSCVENNKHALGDTLEKLQAPQFQNICLRLSQKGYMAECDQTTGRFEEISAMLIFALGAVILP